VSGWGAAAGFDLEQHPGGGENEEDGAAGIGEMPTAQNRRRVRISAELARRACRAVLRSLQLAEEIVMLKRRRDEEQRVTGDADDSEGPPDAVVDSAKHVS
jgi:hypothetical protein